MPDDHYLEAERLFQEYLQLLERGEAPPHEEYIDQHAAEVRPSLQRLFSDFFALQERLRTTEGAYSEGQEIGDFKLVEELGSGAFGVVWKATQTSLNRTVALKLLRPKYGLTPVVLQRFRREAQACGRLTHSSIVQIHAYGESEGLYYIAQEYVPDCTTLAESIAELRQSAKLPDGYYESVAQLFAEVATAIQHAHEADIIHRDLKPANILITAEGQPKVVDFGMAYVEGELGLSVTGERTGTPFYMSPEQAMGRRIGLDRRTDVFSLGATLFEALTFVRAFEGDTERQVFEKIMLEDTSDPRKLRSQVPRDLAIICLKAMEKKRERRYPTMASFAADLRRFLEREPILAKPPSFPSRALKWALRHPVLSMAAGLVAVAATAIVALVGANLDLIRLQFRLAGSGTAGQLRALIEEADRLWLVRPENEPYLRAWLEKAGQYQDWVAEHEVLLHDLRKKALKRTKGEAEGPHPKQGEWERLEERLQGLERTREFLTTNRLTAGSSNLSSAAFEREDPESIRNRLDAAIARTRAALQRLEVEISSSRVLEFNSSLDTLIHRSLKELVPLERELFDKDSGVVNGISAKHGLGVRRRLDLVLRLERESISGENARERWKEAIAAIRTDPRYEGLTLEPQFGLLPIGQDLDSGLWEFADLQTGRAPERNPRSHELVFTPDCGLVFVLIPGGSFTMGAQAENPQAAGYDPFAKLGEDPHEIVLAPFLLSKYEMTQAQWVRVTGSNPSHFFDLSVEGGVIHTGIHPVEHMNWFEAQQVLQRLGFELPTEAQWEYAARAGTRSAWWTGADPHSLRGSANLGYRYSEDTLDQLWSVVEQKRFQDGYMAHAPVHTFAANRFGLHHVHGNVREWCQDDMVPYELATKEGGGRRADLGLVYRIVRGGSFVAEPMACRSAARNGMAPSERESRTGIRPAKVLEPWPATIPRWELRHEDERPIHNADLRSAKRSVAVDGNVLVLGAPSGIREEINSDRVLILRCDGKVWNNEALLQPAERLPIGADFGASVAVSQGTLLIGAPLDHGSVKRSGAVYAFVHEQGAWKLQDKLVASPALRGDLFGTAVDLEGDRAIIGAPGANQDTDEYAGAAYVFVRRGERWFEESKLPHVKSTPECFLGQSVSISGSRVLVTTSPAHAPGTAHIFVRDGEQWVEQQQLGANSGPNPNGFGDRACLDGDTAIIGASAEDTAGVFGGAAYVFVYEDGTWSEQQRLTASDVHEQDRFGGDVAVHGDLALVGAMWKNETASRSGAAYLYLRRGNRWTEIAKLVGRDLGAGYQFGTHLDLSEDRAAITGIEPLEGSRLPYRNLIYVFDPLR